VAKLIGELQVLSPVALSLTRRAVLRGSGLDFERALTEMEELYLGTLMKTGDAMEGIRAFIEKRQPVWAGR
jgi:cyclohexa-1,5-dienecarbonyl-CoA hydratase